MTKRKRVLYVSVNAPEEVSYLAVLKSRPGKDYVEVDNLELAGKKINRGNVDAVMIASLSIPSLQYALDHTSENGIAVIEAAKEKGLPVIVLSSDPSSLNEKVLNSATQIVNTSSLDLTKKLIML